MKFYKSPLSIYAILIFIIGIILGSGYVFGSAFFFIPVVFLVLDYVIRHLNLSRKVTLLVQSAIILFPIVYNIPIDIIHWKNQNTFIVINSHQDTLETCIIVWNAPTQERMRRDEHKDIKSNFWRKIIIPGYTHNKGYGSSVVINVDRVLFLRDSLPDFRKNKFYSTISFPKDDSLKKRAVFNTTVRNDYSDTILINNQVYQYTVFKFTDSKNKKITAFNYKDTGLIQIGNAQNLSLLKSKIIRGIVNRWKTDSLNGKLSFLSGK